LISGLLSSVKHNLSRRREGIFLFELGTIFFYNPDSIYDTGVEEKTCLSAVHTGVPVSKSWRYPKGPFDFFYIKGCVESFPWLKSIEGTSDLNLEIKSNRFNPAFGILVNGREIGVYGVIHENLLKRWEIDQPVYGFEMFIGEFYQEYIRPRVYTTIIPYPKVHRDLSVVIDQELSSNRILMSIKKLGGRILQDTFLYDIYVGEQIASRKKSLTFRLTFQSRERTLTDEEVDEIMNIILEELIDKYGATLRS
jgi:phenylalanyl-tRNA synthetase beta chain